MYIELWHQPRHTYALKREEIAYIIPKDSLLTKKIWRYKVFFVYLRFKTDEKRNSENKLYGLESDKRAG